MIGTLRQCPVEIVFTLFMVSILLLLSAVFGLPISLPSGGKAAFIELHYLYPLLGVAVWGCFTLFGQRRNAVTPLLVALPCYAVILLVHFNLKLWVPYINPALYDDYYWQIDQALRPVVVEFMTARQDLSELVPLNSNFYLFGFIAMFYISFCYHALGSPERFRELFLAALLFQGLGGLSYLIFPAVGPFLYEHGVNTAITHLQHQMLEFYRHSVEIGPQWLRVNGGDGFTAGLGAMPSLHTGGSFLFFLFAWKYGRVLVPLYALLLTFILIAAVANRWHYLIDLPAGLALAWVCLKLAEYFTAERQNNPAPQAAMHTAPAT